MEWYVKLDPNNGKWGVYKIDAAQSLLVKEKEFSDEESAREWATKQEKDFATPPSKNPDPVEEASFESFPASDPPAWGSRKSS